MDLMKEDEYFRTALLGLLAEKGRGAQNTLSIDAGLSDAYVSQIINGKRHATQKTQVVSPFFCVHVCPHFDAPGWPSAREVEPDHPGAAWRGQAYRSGINSSIVKSSYSGYVG